LICGLQSTYHIMACFHIAFHMAMETSSLVGRILRLNIQSRFGLYNKVFLYLSSRVFGKAPQTFMPISPTRSSSISQPCHSFPYLEPCPPVSCLWSNVLLAGSTSSGLHQDAITRSRTPARSLTVLCILQKLVLGLLVAVHDQFVEEAARLALRVVVGLGTFVLLLEVSAGLLVDIILVLGGVEGRVLVVQRELSLDRVANVLHTLHVIRGD